MIQLLCSVIAVANIASRKMYEFQRVVIMIFKLSQLGIFSSILSHSIIAEGKNNLKEITFYFEQRGVISISCVLLTEAGIILNFGHGIIFLKKATQFPAPFMHLINMYLLSKKLERFEFSS